MLAGVHGDKGCTKFVNAKPQTLSIVNGLLAPSHCDMLHCAGGSGDVYVCRPYVSCWAGAFNKLLTAAEGAYMLQLVALPKRSARTSSRSQHWLHAHINPVCHSANRRWHS